MAVVCYILIYYQIGSTTLTTEKPIIGDQISIRGDDWVVDFELQFLKQGLRLGPNRGVQTVPSRKCLYITEEIRK